MSWLLQRMFGQPTGLLGTLGGYIMRYVSAQSYEYAVQLLPPKPSDHILEIGCGSGGLIEQILKVTPDIAHIDAIDPSVEMLRFIDPQFDASGKNQQHTSATDDHKAVSTESSTLSSTSSALSAALATNRLKLHLCRAESLTFATTGSISLIYALNSLQHCSDLSQSLRECRRVLSLGSRMVATFRLDRMMHSDFADKIDGIIKQIEETGFQILHREKRRLWMADIIWLLFQAQELQTSDKTLNEPRND